MSSTFARRSRACGRGVPVCLFLVSALLATTRASADLVITEIHYDPVEAGVGPNPLLEFVEIYNDGPEPYDLTGYRFSRGIGFEFSARTFLDGRSYLAVCRSAAAVRAYYGISNAVGDFAGALDNSGETIELSNPQGAVVSRVAYNDRGKWPGGAKGTGHSLSILTPYSEPDDPDHWVLSLTLGGTPGGPNFGGDVSFQDTVLIERGETWRYSKGTQEASNPVTAWTQRGYSDASWLSGATGIGYGDGDDATQLADMRNGYMSIFCRKTFAVADPSAVDSLILTITYDDGFRAWLNGTEVASRNLAGRDYDSEATDSIEPTTEDIDLSAHEGLLLSTGNVLAVQVHNAGISSSDLSFIPRLVSRRTIEPQSSETVPVVINEGFFLAPAAERFIELYNTSSSPVNLAGWFLSDDYANPEKYAIAAPATIAPHGFLVFGEAQTGLDFSVSPPTKTRVSVALTNPAGTRVTDAVIFEPKVDGASEARYPDGDRRFAPAADPTSGAPNSVAVEADIVLNEILYHPIDDSETAEFVELLNRGSVVADLSGWTLDGVGLVFPPGTTIAAGGYLVLARDPERIARVYGLDAPVLSTAAWTGSLRDGGERLSLIDTRGNVVDSVRYYDGGEWPAWADGGGSSLERIDPQAPSDAPGTWDASDDSAKATTQTITYRSVTPAGVESDLGILLAQDGIMILDDINLARAAGGPNLVSNPTFDANTTSWRFEGTHIRSGRTTKPEELIAGSGSLKLISWNGGGDYKVNRIETNTAAQTAVEHLVSYRARWVVGSPRVITIGDYNVGTPDKAGIAGSNLIVVPKKLGTPGEENGVAVRERNRTGSTNVGPWLRGVLHSPGVPETNEQVRVRAEAIDPDGVAAVRLYYRTETTVGTFTQVAMTDPDGDGVREAVIPGQTLGIRVLFYVEAEDSEGAVSRFPRDILAGTHPPVLDPATATSRESLYCIYRHDTRTISTNAHVYRFIMSQDNEDYLRTRLVLSNEMVDGTFVFGEGTVYYNAQLRFSGSPWLRGSGNWGNSYSLRVPKDNPLHGRKRAFNLDQHGTDARERISHYLLRHSAGSSALPYYDFHALARFRLNGVRDAVYEALDKPNGQYIDFWFPEDGGGYNFEMDDRFGFNDAGAKTGNADGHVLYPPYGATSGGANKENYRWFFSPRSKINEDDFDGLLGLCSLMDARVTTNSYFDTLAAQIIDVDEMLRVWAIELNIDDWDTWSGNRGKNCYLYQSSTDGLWRLVPWDLELTYGNVNATSMPASPTATYGNVFSEIQRMINRPWVKRRFYGILADQVNATSGFFHSGFLGTYAQKLAAAGVGNVGIAQAGGFIDQRANLIRSWIRPAIYPQVRLVISTNSGKPFTATTPTIELAGAAPADIVYLAVLRNGIVLDDPPPAQAFSLANMTDWTLSEVPLSGGENVLTVVGLDSSGNIIDESQIVVTSTIFWNTPAISSIEPSSGSAGDTIAIAGNDFHDGLRVTFGADVPANTVVFSESTDPLHARVVVPDGVSVGSTFVTVRNIDGKTSSAVAFSVQPPLPAFVRGDANASGGVDLSDGLRILFYLFDGVPASCVDALDANDSGAVDLSDALRVLAYIFQGGPQPSAPFPSSGSDPSRGDPLDCAVGTP